jgi:hypothetical protein
LKTTNRDINPRILLYRPDFLPFMFFCCFGMRSVLPVTGMAPLLPGEFAMYRTLFLFTIFTFLFAAEPRAHAQQSLPTVEMKHAISKTPAKTTFYDKYGRRVGSAQTSNSKTTFYDSYGSKTGSRSTAGSGFRYSDRYGSKLSTSRVSGDRTSYYDRYGSKTGSSRISGDRTSYYDRYGRKTGSSRVSGNTRTFYDAYGRKTGSSRVRP